MSLSLSPTGDFLATCHVDDLGVYLWANKTLYAHVDLRPLPADYEPQVMETPSTSHRSQGELITLVSHCSHGDEVFKAKNYFSKNYIYFSAATDADGYRY